MSALIKAELLKLARQPQVLFWGFAAFPVFVTLFKLMLMMFVTLRTGLAPRPDADWLHSVASSFGVSGNALSQLFLAIGMATVFHVEYRYATWRHLVPRAGRMPLYAAKLVFCILCAAVSLFLVGIGDLLLNLGAVLAGGEASGVFDLSRLPLVFGAYGVALLELSVLAALVAAIVILTRSMIGAVIAVFVLTLGSSLAGVYLGSMHDMPPLPSFGAEVLRSGLFAMGNSGPAASMLLFGFAVLLGWLVGAALLGLLAFVRQTLSSE